MVGRTPIGEPDSGGTIAAQEIPARYRAELDGLAELEARGHVHEARLVRRTATNTYAASWDDRSLRRLDGLADRIERILAGHQRPRRPHGSVPVIRSLARRLRLHPPGT
jgi:hypothetical protein